MKLNIAQNFLMVWKTWGGKKGKNIFFDAPGWENPLWLLNKSSVSDSAPDNHKQSD